MKDLSLYKKVLAQWLIIQLVWWQNPFLKYTLKLFIWGAYFLILFTTQRLWFVFPIGMGVSEVAQSCLTLPDPMDCSPPGSSIHGIFQERILERVVISQEIFLTQGLNPGVPHCRQMLYHLSHHLSYATHWHRIIYLFCKINKLILYYLYFQFNSIMGKL